MSWITLQAAVKELSGAVSYGVLYRLARAGKIAGTQVGSRILLSREAFNEYVRDRGYQLIAPAAKRGQAKKGVHRDPH